MDESPCSSWDELSDLIATSPEVWSPPHLFSGGTEYTSGTTHVLPAGHPGPKGLLRDLFISALIPDQWGSPDSGPEPSVDVTRCTIDLGASNQICPSDLMTYKSSGTGNGQPGYDLPTPPGLGGQPPAAIYARWPNIHH